MKLEAFGCATSRRIVDDSGAVLAMIEQYTSGRWAVHHADTDRRICPAIHKTPRAALTWFKANQASI